MHEICTINVHGVKRFGCYILVAIDLILLMVWNCHTMQCFLGIYNKALLYYKVIVFVF